MMRNVIMLIVIALNFSCNFSKNEPYEKELQKFKKLARVYISNRYSNHLKDSLINESYSKECFNDKYYLVYAVQSGFPINESRSVLIDSSRYPQVHDTINVSDIEMHGSLTYSNIYEYNDSFNISYNIYDLDKKVTDVSHLIRMELYKMTTIKSSKMPGKQGVNLLLIYRFL